MTELVTPGPRAAAADTGLSGRALLADGGVVTIREARTGDQDALRELDLMVSDRSLRFRFFVASRGMADQYAATIGGAPQTAGRTSLVAEIGGRIVGTAVLEQTAEDTGEIALLVADSMHGGGIGTLLVEELIIAAHRRRLRWLCADVLTDNSAMLTVLRDLGVPVQQTIDAGVAHITIDLDDDVALADRVTDREMRSERRSLAPVLHPASIAVIGVGSSENSVGRALLRNLTASRFPGRLAVVHPRHRSVLGIECVPDVDRLPFAPDLAVIAVPAASVPDLVHALGRRGAKAILLLSSGFGETGAVQQQQQLLDAVRAHGMRLVGPNCLGVLSTDPAAPFNATFAAMPMRAGGLALASQSGAVGIAVAQSAAARDLGLAAMVSMGNKADVSGNDLLLAWGGDERVTVVGLYLESVGNPRRFARIARHVSRTTPVLALKAGRGAVGQAAGQSHTAASAAAEPIVDALFEQAGVQRVDTLEQLLDAARVIDGQPRPAGLRLAIVGNSGGPEILATDAAEAAHLDVPHLSQQLRETLTQLVPTLAANRNPVDLGAAVQPAPVQAVLDAVARSGEVDAIVTVFAPTLTASPDAIRGAIVSAAASAPVPIVVAEMGATPRGLVVDGTERVLPVFGFPESAVSAMAVAMRAAQMSRRPAAATLRPADVYPQRLQRILDAADHPGSARWLDPEQTAAVLAAAGIPTAAQAVVAGCDEAVVAARRIGYPVVIKRAAGVHKSDTHGVFVGVRDDADVRAAVDSLAGDPVLVQAQHAGAEFIVGGLQDPQFGPIVMTGPGGVLTDLSSEHTVRLAPLAAPDLEQMLSTRVMQRLLGGFRGAQPVSRAALGDVVVRVAWLVDQFPEIAELDLNPVIGSGDTVVAVDAKIRVAAPVPHVDTISRLLGPARA